MGNFFKQLFCNLPNVHRSLLHSLPSPLTYYQTISYSRCRPFSFLSTTPIFTHSISCYSSQSPSAYLSVRIHCPKKFSDDLSDALLCFGASSTSIDEEEEEEIKCDNKDQIYIDSIFTEDQNVDTCISRAANSIGLLNVPSYGVKLCQPYDWVDNTQESFHPKNIIGELWIVPEWMTPPDPRALNIIINPGLAFGTGDHPTTHLCLVLLKSLIKGGEFFLDYGTGSGILAIAALKFGAAHSVAVDIDEQAIESARHNAVLNNAVLNNIGPEAMQLCLVSEKSCSSLNGEMIHDKEKYDVVIANILLNPLLDLADTIASYAKPGAIVAVSGILAEQAPLVMDKYSEFLEDMLVSEMGEWACVHGRKKVDVKNI